MSLTEFLLARIAEDEAVARLATEGSWGRWADQEGIPGWDGFIVIGNDLDDDEEPDPTARVYIEPDADHMIRWDPPRVLAECEAKRRIVKIHTEGLDDFDGSELYSTGCDGCRSVLWPCPTILALLLPYADHPDYREDWPDCQAATR